MCGPRQLKVRLDRIFSDGTSRRSGYSAAAEDGSVSSIEDTLTEGQGRFSEATYKRAEKGDTISRLKAEEIAHAFDVNLTELLSRRGAGHPSPYLSQPFAKPPPTGERDVPVGHRKAYENSVDDMAEAIQARVAWLASMANKFKQRFATPAAEIVVDMDRLADACRDYFNRIAEQKARHLAAGHRASPQRTAAVMCNALAEHLPVHSNERSIAPLFALMVGAAYAGVPLLEDRTIPNMLSIIKSHVSDDVMVAVFGLLMGTNDIGNNNSAPFLYERIVELPPITKSPEAGEPA
jgi:hypothetical protein